MYHVTVRLAGSDEPPKKYEPNKQAILLLLYSFLSNDPEMFVRSEILLYFEPGIKKMSECQTKAGNQNTLTHSVTLSLSLSHFHTLTLSLSYSLTLDMLNNFCFHVYAQKSLSHFHTLALSHSHTLSFYHSLCLDMLNNFCFHV